MSDIPDELTASGAPARRRLATVLKQQRKNMDLSQEEVASRLGWRTPKLSQIELAMRVPGAGDLQDLLAVYDVPQDQWPTYLAVADQARTVTTRAVTGPAPSGHGGRRRPNRCRRPARGTRR